MNNGRCTFIHLQNNQLPEEGKRERRMRKKKEESIQEAINLAMRDSSPFCIPVPRIE